MDPDPTRACFWPPVFAFCFLTWVFFDPLGEKLDNLGFLGENFQNQRWLQLNPSYKHIFRTGSKMLGPDSSLQFTKLKRAQKHERITIGGKKDILTP